ncbi:MAG: hypothetical protein K6F36_03715 [Bacilli bacterium]|nr:hypothetical protein [Bacilli bacterium]
MVWIGVAMSALLTLTSFFVSVRNFNRVNPYSAGFCDLYLLKHMLPDGHPFEFMYKGLPRNRLFPRLFWPCLGTFACAGLTLIAAILAIVLSAYGILGNEIADTVFISVSFGSTIATDLGFMAITTIQNKICYKKMFKTKDGLGFDVRDEIEKKWPGFYKYK